MQQVADAGDVAVNPFDLDEAVQQIDAAVTDVRADGATVLTLGGDHTIALPILRSLSRDHGPIAVLHFDAHLDTWDTYFGAPYTHGTPFRRASEEGLLDLERCLHMGTRGPLYADTDLEDDARLGFQIVRADDYETDGVPGAVERMRRRLGDGPVYVSIDIDVLDPAHAPGTGTPEAGGLTSRELLNTLRGLVGLNIVGADIVEVAPAYDHAEITGIAAATWRTSWCRCWPRASRDFHAGEIAAEPQRRRPCRRDPDRARRRHGVRAARASTRSACSTRCGELASSWWRRGRRTTPAFAADGYARITGRPGVLFLSTGPGALTSLAGLQEAYADVGADGGDQQPDPAGRARWAAKGVPAPARRPAAKRPERHEEHAWLWSTRPGSPRPSSRPGGPR